MHVELLAETPSSDFSELATVVTAPLRPRPLPALRRGKQPSNHPLPRVLQSNPGPLLMYRPAQFLGQDASDRIYALYVIYIHIYMYIYVYIYVYIYTHQDPDADLSPRHHGLALRCCSFFKEHERSCYRFSQANAFATWVLCTGQLRGRSGRSMRCLVWLALCCMSLPPGDIPL